MAGSQFRNCSDVSTAMRQFATGTSHEQAKGSFAPLTSLTALSDAIVCLCEELSKLKAEVDDLRTIQRAETAANPPSAVPRPKSSQSKSSPPKKAAKAAPRRTR